MYRIGIDLGGTNMKAGIVDENHKIVIQDSIPTRVEHPYKEIIRDMAELVKDLLKKIHITEEKLSGIGVGSPGTVDAKNGIVLYFACKIRISNDANCAALGEVMAGAAMKIKNAVLITLGTGVGGGVIIDGQVFEGAHAGGAELGHTSLIFGGERCTCGRRGCAEAYVSATALIREAKLAAKNNPDSIMNELCKGDLSNMNGKVPFDAAEQNDAVGIKVVNDYIIYLGETITNYVNIFRPDIVLLSGGVCNQKEKLTEPLTEYIKTQCFGREKAYVPEVRCAILGNNAGIIGAASLIALVS